VPGAPDPEYVLARKVLLDALRSLPLLKRAKLPPIRLHDLRHTCATILLMAGKHPKYVQELLGHASINITLDTYSHVIEGMDGGLADAMDDTL
jgi:integrase